MKYLFAFLLSNSLLCLPAAAATCQDLTSLSLPHARITVAEPIPPGKFTPAESPSIDDLPGFCRVAATLMPSSDSDIKVEIWMPISGWNGKYEGTGNGGYAGHIAYDQLAAGLRRGYATANTDMGTFSSSSVEGDAVIGHPERWLDWGTRSTHEMTVAAKQIIRAYYEKAPAHAYFAGCSTGGEQGLMEAQRFPDDYEGIVAGAPAGNRTRLHMDILWNFVVMVEANIPSAKLPAITKAILNACTAAKAVVSDNFLSSPSNCAWDPHALECKAGDAPDCLTADQVTAVRKLYTGPQNPGTHASIYPGIPRGSEFGWNNLGQRGGVPPFDSLFKWVFGPRWKWQSFDCRRRHFGSGFVLPRLL